MSADTATPLPRSLVVGSLVLAAAAVCVLAFVPPVAQDVGYHVFADRRPLFGVPNALDVLSNLPFAVVGVAGLIAVLRASTTPASLRGVWLLFHAAVTSVAAGSAWYHLAPSNPTLLWDRLPMSVAFMALTAALIGSQISERAGRRALWPLLAAGVGSVLHWYSSELAGAGDLRPYALVQFVPLLLLPVLVFALPAAPGLRVAIAWLAAGYVLAKVCEHFDHEILALLGVVSGHSLKHVVAACGLVPLVLYHWRQSPAAIAWRSGTTAL